MHCKAMPRTGHEAKEEMRRVLQMIVTRATMPDRDEPDSQQHATVITG